MQTFFVLCQTNLHRNNAVFLIILSVLKQLLKIENETPHESYCLFSVIMHFINQCFSNSTGERTLSIECEKHSQRTWYISQIMPWSVESCKCVIFLMLDSACTFQQHKYPLAVMLSLAFLSNG